jgi:hypothetical protein
MQCLNSYAWSNDWLFCAGPKSGRLKVFRVLLVSIGVLALFALSIAIGVHAFLAAVGHYAPWEQIWAG